jgi:drug/metabolite transporter (DMT)-like permease
VEWSARYLLSILYLSVPSTVIAFAAYLTLLGRIGAGRAAYSTVLVPVVALLLSTFFENYVWTIAALIGVAFVLAGNVIVLWSGQRARA